MTFQPAHAFSALWHENLEALGHLELPLLDQSVGLDEANEAFRVVVIHLPSTAPPCRGQNQTTEHLLDPHQIRPGLERTIDADTEPCPLLDSHVASDVEVACHIPQPVHDVLRVHLVPVSSHGC